MTSLGEAFPIEQARCRELLAVYKLLDRVGLFGATYIESVLSEADAAAISGDAVAMLVAYEKMKECE